MAPVEHHGDPLGSLRDASVEAIRKSGLEWALLSPTSVLETSLLSMVPWIEETGAIIAAAGEGRVAHVAADDVGRAGAAVLVDRFENGRNYVITGPELLSLGEVCEILSSRQRPRIGSRRTVTCSCRHETEHPPRPAEIGH
jgi:uncharacterized protein YbjT (DUF2867 family)